MQMYYNVQRLPLKSRLLGLVMLLAVWSFWEKKHRKHSKRYFRDFQGNGFLTGGRSKYPLNLVATMPNPLGAV